MVTLAGFLSLWGCIQHSYLEAAEASTAPLLQGVDNTTWEGALMVSGGDKVTHRFPFASCYDLQHLLIQSWCWVPRDRTGWAKRKDLPTAFKETKCMGGHCPAGALMHTSWTTEPWQMAKWSWEGGSREDEGPLTPRLPKDVWMPMTWRRPSAIPDLGRLHEGWC